MLISEVVVVVVVGGERSEKWRECEAIHELKLRLIRVLRQIFFSLCSAKSYYYSFCS